MTMKEIGLKLGYPKCCVDEFVERGYCVGDSFNGFCPCSNHQGLTLEEVTELIGRNPNHEPAWLRRGDY